MRLLAWLARMAGYDLAPRDAALARIADLLDRNRVGVVLDVGANVGQYAGGLRAAGYGGRIVSFEPGSRAHAVLRRRAAADPLWTVAARMAIGDADGSATLKLSSRCDMKSLLTMAEATRTAMPKAVDAGAEAVDMRRLESVFDDHCKPEDRVFLKLDTQGFERTALEGAGARLARCVVLQMELSLFANYVGEALYWTVMERAREAGFELFAVLPGYFSKTL